MPGIVGADRVVIGIALAMLSLALILALIRLARGPSLPDRVIALDLMAAISVGILCADAIAEHQPAFLDAGIVVGLIVFLGTVAFARYLERRARGD